MHTTDPLPRSIVSEILLCVKLCLFAICSHAYEAGSSRMKSYREEQLLQVAAGIECFVAISTASARLRERQTEASFSLACCAGNFQHHLFRAVSMQS